MTLAVPILEYIAHAFAPGEEYFAESKDLESSKPKILNEDGAVCEVVVQHPTDPELVVVLIGETVDGILPEHQTGLRGEVHH